VKNPQSAQIGSVYVLPSSDIHDGAVVLVLDHVDHWGDVACLLLDTGERQDVRDWFFSDERRIA
jgi:hypothetical protein